ncbi:M43 family zinc metalloprotease [Chryseolinea sp. H1M3-3]|uniref:M43 family zinc metalloprotease n=1 Tax=Chryseolinea sp. H1M3-3 TaxID=3034144 RepID=UPI0023ED46EC|nr:M43 family zinc metalloprotease [Chryseolinea sp. H1M3-3]
MTQTVFLVIGLSSILSNCYCQDINLDRTIDIPVIFHVIFSDRSHAGTDGSNTDENVPTELLRKELEDLHKDFLLLNSDTSQVLPMYKGRITNPNVNFFFADTILQKDGEKGIIRVNTKRNKHKLFKRSKIIKPSTYLNVYVGNIGGSLTYSNTPWGWEDRDAVFLGFEWVGLGYRLLTHETGHWCGLVHLWGTGGPTGDSQSCTVGDSIADTPPQKEATETNADCKTCPPPFGEATDKSCVAGVPSNFNNFMDYSGCRKMFTKEQVVQIRRNLMTHRRDIWDAK